MPFGPSQTRRTLETWTSTAATGTLKPSRVPWSFIWGAFTCLKALSCSYQFILLRSCDNIHIWHVYSNCSCTVFLRRWKSAWIGVRVQSMCLCVTSTRVNTRLYTRVWLSLEEAPDSRWRSLSDFHSNPVYCQVLRPVIWHLFSFFQTQELVRAADDIRFTQGAHVCCK